MVTGWPLAKGAMNRPEARQFGGSAGRAPRARRRPLARESARRDDGATAGPGAHRSAGASAGSIGPADRRRDGMRDRRVQLPGRQMAPYWRLRRAVNAHQGWAGCPRMNSVAAMKVSSTQGS